MDKEDIFARSKKPYYHDPSINISKILGILMEQAKRKREKIWVFH